MFGKAFFFVTTRLCNACTKGDLETVKSLADASNVNVKGFLGWAPLHNAAHAGHASIVEFLLGLGAEVDIRDLENHTPLLLAAGIAGENDARLKMTCRARISQSLVYLISERVRTVTLLLGHKADANAVDDGKYSALQLAVLNGNQRIVQVLIEAGAAVNHQNNDRFTALHAAATAGSSTLVQYLLSHGADPKLRDGRGHTAADHAKEAGHDFNKLIAADPVAATSTPTQASSETAKKGGDLQGEIEAELRQLEEVGTKD